MNFEKAADLDPSDDYIHFRIWLVRQKLGDQTIATQDLENYWSERKAAAPGDWPTMVERFLIGRLDERQLFAAANDGRDVRACKCEAYFYAGEKRLLDGDRAVARLYFEHCLDTGEKDFTEYASAAAELKALKASE